MPMKQYESRGYMSQKLWQNSRESYHYVFQEWSHAHLSNFNNLCALSNLVSFFIKFDVRSKHAFTSFFLMFTRHAQQTKNVFAAAYSTKITVWCRWMLWFCLFTWSWEAFSCSLDEICSVSWRGVGNFTSLTW